MSEQQDQQNAAQENVAQPPSAVSLLPRPDAPALLAKESKDYTKRNLPHFETDCRPLYVTFCTYQRWILPVQVREKVLCHCLFDNGRKMEVLACIVMPDHVHLLYEPIFDKDGNPFSLTEILSGIKGASAHSVNKLLGRKGHVWQDERFDHIVRTSESTDAKVEYIRMNPVRKQLVACPEEYPWIWVEQRFIAVGKSEKE